MKKGRRLRKHTRRKDLERILTGFTEIKVSEAEKDWKSKEKSKEDENGVGKLENIQARN